MNAGAPEGWTIPAPLVTPVVLKLLSNGLVYIKSMTQWTF
jgi:hypothetical protein